MAGQRQTKQRVSIRQVAEALGLSTATVSLVLNGRARHYGLSEATEARVRLQAAAMGYSLAKSRRGSPGILIAGLGELYHVTPAEFVAPILDPMLDELVARGWHIMVTPNNRIGVYGVTPEMLARASAIVIPTRGLVENLARNLVIEANRLGVVPIVLGRVFQDLDAIYVDVDNHAGGQTAARHLYDLGHRRVAVVLGVQGDSHTENRLRGFSNFFAERNVPLSHSAIWGYGQYMTTGGHAVTLDRLGRLCGPRPTAIFYMSDTMALGGNYALREAGLRVPHDVSIMGYDDNPSCSAMVPTLTSVGLEAGQRGLQIANAVIDFVGRTMIEPMQVLCPPRLVVRGSTARPSAAKEERT